MPGKADRQNIFRLAGDQMDRLIKLFPRPETTSWNMEKLFKLVQIMAILGAGCWAIYEYFDYKRQANKLDAVVSGLTAQDKGQDVQLKEIQLKYADEQQKTLQRQQQLQVDLARLSIQDKEKDTALKGIELQYSDQQHKILQQQATLAIDLDKVNIKGRTTEGELRGLELQYSRDRNIDYSGTTLSAEKIGDIDKDTGLYDLELSFSLKNNSKVELEVTYTVVQYYAGSLIDDLQNKETETKMLRIDFPPNIFGTKSEAGAILWKHIGTEAYMYAEAEGQMMNDDPYVTIYRPLSNPGAPRSWKYNFSSDGGGTGKWKPGEQAVSSYEYLIRARKADFIGIVVNLCLNRCQKSEDHFYYFKRYRLADLETGKTAEAAVIP